MLTSTTKLLSCSAVVLASGAAAFSNPPRVVSNAAASSTSTALNVAVDPTVVTKKEYEDICGVTFDEAEMNKRLQATNYLYPKHVEVIEDIAPIADAMVDDIVSVARFQWFLMAGVTQVLTLILHILAIGNG